jgi:hypothetical protein
MNLNYLLWFLVGIFGKIYDDCVDIYFIKHGTFLLEFIKIIVTSLGLLILTIRSNIYTYISLALLFSLGILDTNGYLNDRYWCAITICTVCFCYYHILLNIKNYTIKNLFILAIIYGLIFLPQASGNNTLNGFLIDYLYENFLIIKTLLLWTYQYSDDLEISVQKLRCRFCNIIWFMVLLYIIFAVKNKDIISHKDVITHINEILYFCIGYASISVLNQYYNLYINNIYEKNCEKLQKKREKKKKKREKKKKKREKNLKIERN